MRISDLKYGDIIKFFSGSHSIYACYLSDGYCRILKLNRDWVLIRIKVNNIVEFNENDYKECEKITDREIIDKLMVECL